MRYFRMARPGWQVPVPTPSEAYVLREFTDAIAFVGGEWQRFDTGHRREDPHWADKFSLKQRILAFATGPVGTAVVERWPAIATTGAEADEQTGTTGNMWVICLLVIGEAIIAAGGGTRAEVRAALPD